MEIYKFLIKSNNISGVVRSLIETSRVFHKHSLTTKSFFLPNVKNIINIV